MVFFANPAIPRESDPLVPFGRGQTYSSSVVNVEAGYDWKAKLSERVETINASIVSHYEGNVELDWVNINIVLPNGIEWQLGYPDILRHEIPDGALLQVQPSVMIDPELLE